MLPPVEGSVLAANPKFNALYRDLCTNKLEQDGTSKLNTKARQERASLEDEIHRVRHEAYQRDIICSNLQQLAYRGEELPDDLRELVALAAATLNGDIADEDRELVDVELERFAEVTSVVAAAVSRSLNEDIVTLARLLSGEPLHPTYLQDAIKELQTEIATSHTRLAHSRLALAQDAQVLHDLYRQVLETSIRTLEQTIHGSVARGIKAQADYLATVAEGMSKKLSVQHAQLLQQVYTAEVQDLLRARVEGMQAESALVKRKVREGEERLEAYRRVKGGQGLAREYAEVLKESDKVRREIGRLEGTGS